MKKTFFILTAPLLLIDACASVRLAQKETTTEKSVQGSTSVPQHESMSHSSIDPKKQIVARELSNGEFDLSTRFEPVIKDHYRKEALQLKPQPEN